MNLNQIVNMILRLLMRRAINTGVNASINAASNLAKKQKRGGTAGPDRYGVPLQMEGAPEEDLPAAQPQGQQKMTPEQRERQRQIRQARRAARAQKTSR